MSFGSGSERTLNNGSKGGGKILQSLIAFLRVRSRMRDSEKGKFRLRPPRSCAILHVNPNQNNARDWCAVRQFLLPRRPLPHHRLCGVRHAPPLCTTSCLCVHTMWQICLAQGYEWYFRLLQISAIISDSKACSLYFKSPQEELLNHADLSPCMISVVSIWEAETFMLKAPWSLT